MDKKELFRAIDACEDRFIRGAAEDIQKRKKIQHNNIKNLDEIKK